MNPKPRDVHHGGRRSPTRIARTDEAPATEARTAPATEARTIENPNLGFSGNRPSDGGQSSFCEKSKPKLTTAHFLTCVFPEPPLAKLPETAFEAQNPSQNDGSPPPESRFRAKRIIDKTWRQRGRRAGGFACFGRIDAPLHASTRLKVQFASLCVDPARSNGYPRSATESASMKKLTCVACAGTTTSKYRDGQHSLPPLATRCPSGASSCSG